MFYKRNKKLVLRELLSSISTREFLRTREKCGEARAENGLFDRSKRAPGPKYTKYIIIITREIKNSMTAR